MRFNYLYQGKHRKMKETVETTKVRGAEWWRLASFKSEPPTRAV